MEATHITTNPRSGKLGMVSKDYEEEDDEDDDDDGVEDDDDDGVEEDDNQVDGDSACD